MWPPHLVKVVGGGSSEDARGRYDLQGHVHLRLVASLGNLALGDYTKTVHDFTMIHVIDKEGRSGPYWLSCSACDKVKENTGNGSKRRARFRDINQLKGHLIHQRKVYMCSLRLEGRKLFESWPPLEYKLPPEKTKCLPLQAIRLYVCIALLHKVRLQLKSRLEYIAPNVVVNDAFFTYNLFGLNQTLKANIIDSDEESLNDEDINEVTETIFEDGKDKNIGVEVSFGNLEIQSEDPFNLYPLLVKKKGENLKDTSNSASLKFPPGFTPSSEEEVWDDNHEGLEQSDAMNKGTESVGSGCTKKASSMHSGGSLLHMMDELIKETKMESIDLFDIKRCWGNFTFDYAHSNSVGNSGGILCVWDTNSFKKNNVTISDYFVMIRGDWISNGNKLLIISVYAPQELPEKQTLWDYIGHAIDSWKGEVIIMGDFNEVRYKNERFGSIFNVQGANAFNSFIGKAGLEEVPLGGCTFTWCHKSASKMSKLDRFLISESLLISCPNISAITLDRFLSDHRPILLRESSFDYGPTPFRFFHYWLEVDGFDKLVSDTWQEPLEVGPNHMLNLMNKLKNLKKKIRTWNKERQNSKSSKPTLLSDLAEVDQIIDKGNAPAEIIDKRIVIMQSLQELNKHKSMEMAQKAKIKWAIEGDENSKYFHGILNKQRSRSAIRGVLASGNWIENPILVKHEFLNHFKHRFERPNKTRPSITMNFPRHLNSVQQSDMEADVTTDEIKKAVWECGSDKSPGPDGFSFGFYRHFWYIIQEDVVAAVRHFFHSGTIPKGCNSSFIALIPKIPDAKMVKDFRPISLISSLYKIIAKILANRLVTVLRDLINELKKKQSFIFKIDFEKAFDSVRWDHLDENLVETGMFKGVALDSSTIISHMFYADDAVFVGQWDNSNIKTVTYALKCFEKASGLRINMGKSKIMGIAVNDEKVNQVAHRIGCGILKVPFTYLGSKVGGCMSRSQAWSDVIAKMNARLSKWKMKTLSIGGRLTLLKSVLGSMSIYHMSIFKVPMGILCKMESIRSRFFHGINKDGNKAVWVNWNKVLAAKVKGGLGVSSLYALNRALLFKWIWRFTTHKSSLWARVITAIHGIEGNIGSHSKKFRYKSLWRDIVSGMEDIKKQGADLRSFIHKKIGEFSVASVRKLIDDIRLPEVSSQSRWIKEVPIKVGDFVFMHDCTEFLVVACLVLGSIGPLVGLFLCACSISHGGSCECFCYSCGNELIEHLSVNAAVDIRVVSVGRMVDWGVQVGSSASYGYHFL
ncbi:RNA-directed DNA polymerase, eukaryota [Tanacetum coccineum]